MIDTKTDVLLDAIERRLAAISERQHALAVEKAHLLDQITPLRLGVVAPALAVTLLKAKGITLKGLGVAQSADRPAPAVLRSVSRGRPRIRALPPARSESA